MTRRSVLRFLLPLMFATAASSNAVASRRGRRRERYDNDEYDYNRARQAYEKGHIKSLLEILDKVRQKYPGDVVDIDSEDEGGIWIYEIKVIDKRGRLLEIKVNATTKEIIKVLGE